MVTIASAMIRLLHTSDWHLGRTLYGKSLLEDQKHFIEQLLKLIDRDQPDGLIIAGDIFDRSLPPESAVTLFDFFLNEAAGKRSLPLFIIPGNHDSSERVGFAARLLRDKGVTIFSRVEDALSPVTLVSDDGVNGQSKAMIFGIPFVEPLVIGQYLGRDDIRSPDAAIKGLCEKMQALLNPETPSVLICHAFVTGGEVSDSEKEIYIGGSSQVDASAFKTFTYTALGHLHKPQKAGHERVRYSGSPLPYSKSETEHLKSVTEVRIHSSENVEILEHRLPLLRQLRYLEGELDHLVREGLKDPNRQDYIIAGYTDNGAVLDAYAKLRKVYENLLHISRSGGYMPDQLPALEKAKAQDALSDFELFSEFFRDSTGADLNEAEREALIQTLKRIDAEEKSS